MLSNVHHPLNRIRGSFQNLLNPWRSFRIWRHWLSDFATSWEKQSCARYPRICDRTWWMQIWKSCVPIYETSSFSVNGILICASCYTIDPNGFLRRTRRCGTLEDGVSVRCIWDIPIFLFDNFFLRTWLLQMESEHQDEWMDLCLYVDKESYPIWVCMPPLPARQVPQEWSGRAVQNL